MGNSATSDVEQNSRERDQDANVRIAVRDDVDKPIQDNATENDEQLRGIRKTMTYLKGNA